MYYKHRYNLIRFDLSTSGTAYKLFIKSLYDYVIVKEVTVSDVTVRSYFVGAKDLEANWSNRASLTYSTDIKGRKLVNEGQNWLAANTGVSFTGLLDTYSGAAAAYSLRRLSTSYSGDAIVVRRSSDNATQSIGFVNNQLDTSSLNSFCSGADGFVTTWYDQSGNSNDAANTTASLQPKVFDSVSGLILENGKAAMQFGSSIFLRSAFDASIYPVSGFITFRGQVGGFLFDDDNNINTNSLVILNSTDIRLYNASGANIVHTISANWNVQHLTSFIVDSTSSLLAIDSDFTAGTMGIDSLSGATLGNAANGTLGMNGTMQEVVIYSTNQSSNRTGIETNINDFYNIY